MSPSTLLSTGPRPIRAPRGPERTCKGWIQEAALRMLMNNLDPDVAEDPDHLVVYGGSGKAARTWEAYHGIVAALRRPTFSEDVAAKKIASCRNCLARAAFLLRRSSYHSRRHSSLGLRRGGAVATGAAARRWRE